MLNSKPIIYSKDCLVFDKEKSKSSDLVSFFKNLNFFRIFVSHTRSTFWFVLKHTVPLEYTSPEPVIFILYPSNTPPPPNPSYSFYTPRIPWKKL